MPAPRRLCRSGHLCSGNLCAEVLQGETLPRTSELPSEVLRARRLLRGEELRPGR